MKCTIGHNRMTRQPSCLQCKQADRDCVSRSRLSVSALLVCSMLLCGRLLVLHYLSAPQLQGVRHCDVCFMCQIWALNLNPSIFSNSSQMGLGRGSNCIPAGYFSSSLVSASGGSFSVTLNIVPPLERHVFVTKTLHAILLDCGTRNCLCVVCLTLCQWQWTRNVMFLSSCLTFITVLSLTDCMEPTMWPAAVLINMTSACLVRLSVLWPDQVQHEPRLWPQHFVHHYDSVT